MSDIELDERQAEAVEMIATGTIGVITGGPGTGKTTCLKSALGILKDQGKRVLLMAPTGKAARRMEEATMHTASTVHRALGWCGGHEWEFNASNPFETDVVVVDEASMLDIHLAASLLNAIDERRTSVFFVGDVDQLPSVGPGYVLGDLIAGQHVPVVRLRTLHRSAQQSWMNRNAPRILDGDFAGLELATAPDFAFVRVTPEHPEHLVAQIESELNEVQRLSDTTLTMQQAFEGLQVLIPMKRGALGVHNINSLVQDAVQGRTQQRNGWELTDGTRLFADDKVMQTKNDYQLGLMNGEQGIVAGTRDKQLVVDFNGESHHFSKAQSWNLMLAYATTIHKSQGSEWPVVVVACHSSHGRMLCRQLLYTAVTRAKQRVVIVGDDDGLKRALRNDMVADRQTGLKQAVTARMGV